MILSCSLTLIMDYLSSDERPVAVSDRAFTTAMGFAFSLDVLSRFLQGQSGQKMAKLFDMIALASAVFIPLLMMSQPIMGGLVQRVLFLVACNCYGREAWQLPKAHETGLTG